MEGLRVDSEKLEYACRVICAGAPSCLALFWHQRTVIFQLSGFYQMVFIWWYFEFLGGWLGGPSERGCLGEFAVSPLGLCPKGSEYHHSLF